VLIGLGERAVASGSRLSAGVVDTVELVRAANGVVTKILEEATAVSTSVGSSGEEWRQFGSDQSRGRCEFGNIRFRNVQVVNVRMPSLRVVI
jgi:hypothetical protein